MGQDLSHYFYCLNIEVSASLNFMKLLKAAAELVDYFVIIIVSLKSYSQCFTLRFVLISQERESSVDYYSFVVKQVQSLEGRSLTAEFAVAIIAKFDSKVDLSADSDKNFVMFIETLSEVVIKVNFKDQHC